MDILVSVNISNVYKPVEDYLRVKLFKVLDIHTLHI